MPDTASGTPLGQSSQSGIRLTGAWADDAAADPFPADVPVEIPPAVGIVLMLPDEALPGAADREPRVAKPGDIDPTTPVPVVAVAEDAAPCGVTVVGAEGVAAEPIDVVVLVGALEMLPLLVPACPLTWLAAGTARPALSSKANLNECAIAIPPERMTTVRTIISAPSSVWRGRRTSRSVYDWSVASATSTCGECHEKAMASAAPPAARRLGKHAFFDSNCAGMPIF